MEHSFDGDVEVDLGPDDGSTSVDTDDGSVSIGDDAHEPRIRGSRQGRPAPQ